MYSLTACLFPSGSVASIYSVLLPLLFLCLIPEYLNICFVVECLGSLLHRSEIKGQHKGRATKVSLFLRQSDTNPNSDEATRSKTCVSPFSGAAKETMTRIRQGKVETGTVLIQSLKKLPDTHGKHEFFSSVSVYANGKLIVLTTASVIQSPEEGTTRTSIPRLHPYHLIRSLNLSSAILTITSQHIAPNQHSEPQARWMTRRKPPWTSSKGTWPPS
jgi:hypothetical protein